MLKYLVLLNFLYFSNANFIFPQQNSELYVTDSYNLSWENNYNNYHIIMYMANKSEEKKVSSNDLAIKRTRMANQRTYLAYMRTGFGIASLAGAFKKWWIAAFGIIMIIFSSIQYLIVNQRLNEKMDPNVRSLEKLPIIYVILALGILYLQWNK